MLGGGWKGGREPPLDTYLLRVPMERAPGSEATAKIGPSVAIFWVSRFGESERLSQLFAHGLTSCNVNARTQSGAEGCPTKTQKTLRQKGGKVYMFYLCIYCIMNMCNIYIHIYIYIFTYIYIYMYTHMGTSCMGAPRPLPVFMLLPLFAAFTSPHCSWRGMVLWLAVAMRHHSDPT